MITVSLKQAFWASLYCLNMLGNIDLVEFIKNVPHFKNGLFTYNSYLVCSFCIDLLHQIPKVIPQKDPQKGPFYI